MPMNKKEEPGFPQRHKELSVFKSKMDDKRQKSIGAKVGAHVVSPGGVASSMLLRHISGFIDSNLPNDADGLKHLPRFKQVPAGSDKVIYLAGNPLSVIKSLERRGYHRLHIIKLGLGPRLAATKLWRPVLYGLIIRQHVSFKIASMLNPRKVLVVSHDELWEKKDQIGQFLELKDHKFTNTFPEKKRRKTG